MGLLDTVLNIGAGFATGGASVYWRAAAMAFMLVKGGPTQKGPRLSNLSITLDGEGQEIARGWGRWLQEMRLVYTSGLIEKKKSKKSGGLLGTSIGASKVTTYKYGTKCVMIGGRGLISRVNRIDLNQFALYDYNGGEEQGAKLVWNGQFWEGQTKAGIKIRVYPGTLDQPVDPVLVAAKGENAWTNYPGHWLVVLEIPDLKKYGDSMPRVSVEAQYDVTDLPSIIEEIGSWVGLEAMDFDLSALDALTVAPTEKEGFSVDSRRKAADIIAELMDLFHFSLPEVDGVLRAVLRPGVPVFSLRQDDLQVTAGYKSERAASSPLRLADEESLSQIKEIVSRDPDRKNAPGYRYARRTGLQVAQGGTKRKTTFQTSAAMSGARASDVARVLLAEEWAGALGVKGTLGVEHLWLSAGDEGTVETEDGLKYVVLDDASPPLFGPIEVTLMGLDPLVYNLPLRDETAGIERPTPLEKGALVVFVGEIPIVGSQYLAQKAYAVGACRLTRAAGFDGAVVNVDRREPGGDWKEVDEDELEDEAIIGELTSDWTPAASSDSTDEGFSCRVWGGALSSAVAGREDVNLILFSNGLLCTLQNLTQTAGSDDSRFYSVEALRVGVYGSDDLKEPFTAGTRFMLLSDESGAMVEGPQLGGAPPMPLAGTELRLRINEQDGGEQVTWDLGAFVGENTRVPSPVVTATRADDGTLTLAGSGRTRFYETATLGGLPSGSIYRETEFGQGFKFQVNLSAAGNSASATRYTTDDQADFTFEFPAPELATLLNRTAQQIADDDIAVSMALYGEVALGRAANLVSAVPSDHYSTIKPAFGTFEINTNHALAQGLVSLLLLNEGSGGTINDAATLRTTMTRTGAWTPDGLFFDGSELACTLSPENLPLGMSPRTLAARMRILDNGASVMCSYGQYTGGRAVFLYCHEFQVRASQYGAALGGVQFTADNQWRNAVIRFDGTLWSVFTNGVLEAQAPLYTDTLQGDTYYLGGDPIGDRFRGDIGHVMVWERALSDEEIAQLHATPYAMLSVV